MEKNKSSKSAEAARGFTVALAGNPNVGKSTLFNALTGMRQHTGNWPGKTVAGAVGRVNTSVGEITLVDVPGTYSLIPHSPEEEVARDYICGGTSGERGRPDGVLVVCDACTLERSLILALQIMKTGISTALCVNLMDEADRRGVTVDIETLSRLTGVPAVPCSAAGGRGIDGVRCLLADLMSALPSEETACTGDFDIADGDFAAQAGRIAAECTVRPKSAGEHDRRLDKIFTGRLTAFPVAALLLALVLFITLKLSPPLSDGLAFLLTRAEGAARRLLIIMGCHETVTSALCDGVLRVLFWVVAVMLPPMAIFFPLFTILEDLGYLPRVAYNFDRCYRACGSCGKQALTTLMGFGCNAAAVTGCRIIDSPRERMIAILTNSLVPCNGRFPVLATMASVLSVLAFGKRGGALFSTAVICALVAGGLLLSLCLSFVLSRTLLRGMTSSFTLELPPYRIPNFKEVLIRSVFDRTLSVLGRAAAVAAPAGLVIWILGNFTVGGGTLLAYMTSALDPVGSAAGMDGVMLGAFVLALPAAEITVPAMLMGYGGGGVPIPGQSLDAAAEIFEKAGWTEVSAVCAMVFTLIHWPCSTTVITVYRETGKLRWAAASALIPTALGYCICALIAAVAG